MPSLLLPTHNYLAPNSCLVTHHTHSRHRRRRHRELHNGMRSGRRLIEAGDAHVSARLRTLNRLAQLRHTPDLPLRQTHHMTLARRVLAQHQSRRCQARRAWRQQIVQLAVVDLVEAAEEVVGAREQRLRREDTEAVLVLVATTLAEQRVRLARAGLTEADAAEVLARGHTVKMGVEMWKMVRL